MGNQFTSMSLSKRNEMRNKGHRQGNVGNENLDYLNRDVKSFPDRHKLYIEYSQARREIGLLKNMSDFQVNTSNDKDINVNQNDKNEFNDSFQGNNKENEVDNKDEGKEIIYFLILRN
jgi:hypothetical protein